jgi:hypothetical protein
LGRGGPDFFFRTDRRYPRCGRLGSHWQFKDRHLPSERGNWYVDKLRCTDLGNQGCNFNPNFSSVFQFGLPGDFPIVGDWDHTGVLRIGVFRPSTNQWILNLSTCTNDIPTCNQFSTGNIAIHSFAPFGTGGRPITGIWNGGTSGPLNVGMFNAGTWGLDSNGNYQWDASDPSYVYGLSGDIPVMGPWNTLGTFSAGSLIPSNATGSAQVFTVVYSDSAGATALNRRLFFINSSLTAPGACIVQVDARGAYLDNDANSALIGPLTGTGTLSNSQCTLHGIGTGVSNTGNTSTVTLSITFKAAFAGAKNIYLLADDSNGGSTGFVLSGTYTVAAGPTVDSVTPSNGTGSAQVFTAVYSDAAGAAGLNRRLFLINSSQAGPGGCLIQVDPTGTYLANDADTGALSGPLASTGTLSNSQCTLNGAGSGVSNSGNSSTVTLSIAFKAAFAGPKGIYLSADDTNGNTIGFQTRGAYTVATGPTPDSVTPSTGTGSSQIFTAVYSDPGGAAQLLGRGLLINSSVNGVASCLVNVDPTGTYLMNDANTALLGPLTSTLSNSQCTLNGTGTSVVNSGNSSTVTLAITFAAAFAGPKSVYLSAGDALGVNSGWQSKGSYNVAAPAVIGQIPSVWTDFPSQGSTVTGTVVVTGWALESRTAIGNGIGNVMAALWATPFTVLSERIFAQPRFIQTGLDARMWAFRTN